MSKEVWFEAVKDLLDPAYFQQMTAFLDQVYQKGKVYPPREKVFAALDACDPDQVQVVILGQDPYHGPGQAQGLAFSVPDDLPAPPSLRNILKELEEDLGHKRGSHDLTAWARQGVLLLNSSLTVEEGKAASHQGLIWEPLTDAIFSVLAEMNQPKVFILWGAAARKKSRFIHRKNHLVLESAHPSPLSAYRGFFGSKPFSRCQEFLESQDALGIDWLKE